MQLLTIETPRLRLRPFREDDLDALAALYADADVMRHIGDGQTMDRVATWRAIAQFLGHQQLRGYSTLAIEDRTTGEFLGECGPWFPAGWPMLEVGWLVAPGWQGKGIATEAGRAVLDWCFANLQVEQICSLIRPGNQASARRREVRARHERSIEDFFGGPTDMWLHRRPG